MFYVVSLLFVPFSVLEFFKEHYGFIQFVIKLVMNLNYHHTSLGPGSLVLHRYDEWVLSRLMENRGITSESS